jgi:tryptophanyl-tRNA synthetase
LHAITVSQDPRVLGSKLREVAGLLFAAGFDPDPSDVFAQAHTSAHADWAWMR